MASIDPRVASKSGDLSGTGQPATTRDQKEENQREGGKLTPAEAEAISSADLPSGDPELSAPAEKADRSPDRKPGKAA